MATPHAFGSVSTSSPTKSSALDSHYHVRGVRTGGRGGHRHDIHCNYCNLYGHIEVDCRTKAREQQRKPQVTVVSQLDITKNIVIPAADYNDFLQFKVAR